MKLRILFSLLLVSITCLSAQRVITLEDVWQNGVFQTRILPGFRFLQDGKHYSQREGNRIVEYDLVTGRPGRLLFDGNAYGLNHIDDYSFSSDESKILIQTSSQRVYRHSTLDIFLVFDMSTGSLKPLFEEARQQYASFSPDGSRVAFVSNNNIYYKDLSSDKVRQITHDGKRNEILNGGGDWVYEEEFTLVKAYEWSPDGTKIAYIRFDETRVPEFTMMKYHDSLYPEYVTFKYPKVGERNSLVKVKIFDLGKGKTEEVNLGNNEDIYVPRIKWFPDSEELCVFRMNRHQNHLELLNVKARNGRSRVMLEEKNRYYIDIHDNLTFLDDGRRFIWSSEQDGYNHIYLYDIRGRKVAQLTKGNFDVTSYYGYDPQRERIFYQAAERSPLKREIYSVDLNGSNNRTLADGMGYQSAQFSSTFDYYVLQSSDANSPTSFNVFEEDGSFVRTLENNEHLKAKISEYRPSPVEFFEMQNRSGTTLHGWMIKPPGFDSGTEYPLLMFLYGGPGSQMVVDRWEVRYHWWFQMMAQKGFVIACIDNRGTGARGEEFKKMTYLQLGKFETEDQIDAAHYLSDLPFIDDDNVGIFGWSYGGYMSSLCLLKGNDVFKAAIAVAPVTNWKWYDTIYTERYMRTESENRSGYQDNSPVYFADRLKGDYLLVHGMADDNVHFQHTVEMVNALIANNKQFDTYFYPNQAHGISGGNSRLHLFSKITSFITEKLLIK